MLRRLRERNEWKFFGVLPKADRLLAITWWVVLVLRGVLPALFAIVMGLLVGAVQRGDNLAGPLTLVGGVFGLLMPPSAPSVVGRLARASTVSRPFVTLAKIT